MPLRVRLFWGLLLVDVAVVFVLAVLPLHAKQTMYLSSEPSSVSCGSVLKNMVDGSSDRGLFTKQTCDSVVGHRRSLLLELGIGAIVVIAVGLELAFGRGKRRANQPDEGDDVSATVQKPVPLPMISATLAEIERLNNMRSSGALTEAEFDAFKARVLASGDL